MRTISKFLKNGQEVDEQREAANTSPGHKGQNERFSLENGYGLFEMRI